MRAAGAPGGPGKLTTAQQEYIVERLAGFDNPGTVMRSVREKFGIAITRQSVEQYDPTRYRRCPARWTTLFHLRRQAILESRGLQGALDHAARLRGRARVTLCAIETLAADMLDSLARQIGGGAAQPAAPPLTDAERVRAILALLAKAQIGPAEPGDVALLAKAQIDGPGRD
jgi:hypothetical protein